MQPDKIIELNNELASLLERYQKATGLIDGFDLPEDMDHHGFRHVLILPAEYNKETGEFSLAEYKNETTK